MNLWAYLDNQRELNRINDLIEVLDSKIQGLGIDYSRVKVKTTPKNDKISDLIDLLNELKQEQEAKKETAVQEMARVVEVIDSLDDTTQKELLQKRYIDGDTWDSIGQQMGYTWRHLIRLHNQALEKIRGQQ